MNVKKAVRTSLRYLPAAVCAGCMLIGSAYAQDFFDCEARPGEYIVKYKSTKNRSLAAKASAQKAVRASIGGKTKRIFSDISPDLELVQGAASLKEARQILQEPTLAKEVEYIQPNCIYRFNDFSVTGNLRDPGRKNAAYPLTLVVPDTETGSSAPLLNINSPHQGLKSIPLEVPITDEKKEVVYRQFNAKKVALWQDPFHRDGLTDLMIFGTVRLPDLRNGGWDYLVSLMVMKNKGNGSFTMSDFGLLSSSYLDYISAMSTAYIDEDSEPDFLLGISSFNSGRIAIISRKTGDSFSKTFIEASGEIQDLQTADINGDNITDIIALVKSPRHEFNIFLGRGGGKFQPRTAKNTPIFSNVTRFNLKDINLDGDVDIIMLSLDDMIWQLNQGGGSFSGDYRYNFGEAYGYSFSLTGDEMVVTDLNGDTYPDIAVLGSYNPPRTAEDRSKKSAVTLIKNSGGSFTGAHGFLVGDYVETYKKDRLFVDDVNGDGRMDIAIARGAHGVVRVLLNEPTTNPGWVASLSNEETYEQEMLGSEPLPGVFLDPYAIAQARVSLTGGGQTFWATTNELGDYTFTGIPAGTYEARAHVDRYEFPTLDGKTFTITQDSTLTTQYGKRMPPAPPSPPAVRVVNATNDYGFNSLWGHHNYGQEGGLADVDVDAPEAWSVTQGEGVVVGVIDSGLDVEHPDIENNVFVNSGEIPYNEEDDDGNGYTDDARGFNPLADESPDPIDDQGHGTSVSGIIAAQGNNVDGLVGVAPKVKVIGTKSSSGRQVDLGAIIAGADYLIKAKKRGVNIRVVNGSYGVTSPCIPAELEYLSALHAQGILFVAAAGNETFDNDVKPSSPANCNTPSLLSVAAVDRSGALSNFSNYGKTTVDVAGPGTDIVMLSPEAGYTVKSGTSMAAPYVSGVAALLFAKNPNLTPVEVKKIIMDSIKPLPALKDKMVSPGVVSAAIALGIRSRTDLIGPPPLPSGPNPSPGAPTPSTSAPPVGTTGKPIAIINSKATLKSKTPYTLKISEALTVQSLSCFQASFSPRKSGRSVVAKIQGSRVSFSLVQKHGKKASRVAWPSKGTLSIKIKGDCATGANGSLLDTDGDGGAGGPAKKMSVKAGR